MALATVTSNAYGYRATGGTDATPVTTNTARVKSFIFVAAAAADTCTITDKNSNGVIVITSTGTAGDICPVDWYESPLDGIRITLSNASGIFIALIC